MADTTPIEDLGEKIGGARKDTADRGYTVRGGRSDDTRPGWARRFRVSQIQRGPGQINAAPNEGMWVIHDLRSTDYMGRPKQFGKPLATKEEADAQVPLAALAIKHRVVPLREGRFEISREVSDRKRVRVVQQDFASREEAMAYMVVHAVEIIETNTTFGEADLPLPPDRARHGPARREGDVTGADFMRTFGLRGVEFGNWNNQDERQALLNDAYDALLDMADVLQVQPTALSLDGSLALAFGARGHGLSSARAHYEPERTVMNLTKERGAGSLAHEWFHALDHYLGRVDGKAISQWKTMVDGTRTLDVLPDGLSFATAGFSRSSKLPQGVRDAIDTWQRTMKTRPESFTVDQAKIEKFVSDTHQNLADRLQEIRRDLQEQLDPRYYKRNNKPATPEQMAEFEALAARALAGGHEELETDWRPIEGSRALASYRYTNDILEALNALRKTVRGRSGFDSQTRHGIMDKLAGTMSRHAQRLKELDQARKESVQTRNVPTEFAMAARELDQGRGTDYWTQPTEMAARAFQAWVDDRLQAQGQFSRFLNYAPERFALLTPWGAAKPYPAGEERVRINAAFDRVALALREQHVHGEQSLPPLFAPLEDAATQDDAQEDHQRAVERMR